ncbi:MAG: SRPBCC family protein [Bacteroidetes bacterium]|nr:SRPBCC family protein [Bacteroidota bacterium]MCY4205924.1 SRPBCC family protein [Bacteroidota bacterium]
MKFKIDIRTPEDGDSILSTSQWIPLPLEATFAFFSDARNLERITPPFLSFRIVTPTPIEMQPGTLIDYQLRLRGFPIRWRTEITVWDPPHGFTDIQLRGPYLKWVHRHEFRVEKAGTRVEDTVHYLVPGGRLIDRLIVKPDLRKVFAYRHARIEELLVPSEDDTPTAPSLIPD